MACALLKSNHLTTHARREPHNRLRLRREILIRRRPLYDQPLMPHTQRRRQASVACIRRWRSNPRARPVSIAVEMEALARMHVETSARLAAYRDEIRAGCHLCRAKDAFFDSPLLFSIPIRILICHFGVASRARIFFKENSFKTR